MAIIPSAAPPQVMPQVGKTQVTTPNPEALNRSGQAIAGGLQDTSNTALREQALQTQEDQALARVKAGNALIDRESQLKTITADLGEKMRTGEVAYDKGAEAYNAAVTKLDPIETPGLDEVTRGEFGNSLKRLQVGGADRIQGFAATARIGAAQSDLTSRMDMLGKDAALPDANVDQINSRMDAEDVDVAGRLAFGDAWTSKKQEFKDGNWATHATQRVIGSRDDLGSLKQVEHDLTAADGFYASKLDPDKRNQLLNTVTGRIYQVKEHQQRQADIRENKADRALNQMDRQAASGVPPTPADQQRWKALTEGTSLAGEFDVRMGQMMEVQGVMRLPLAEQAAYVAKKRQNMAANGASVAEQANVNRFAAAVDSNVKMLKDNPLGANAMSTGVDVPPLDISGIATPEGKQQIIAQISDRFDVVNAVRKSYGPEVARNPWKPEEVTMLKSVLAQADDGTKLQLLSAIAASSSSGQDLTGALKPLGADDPLLMIAGHAQFNGWKSADGIDVAKTILLGEKMMKDKSVPAPKADLLASAFDVAIGNSIPVGTPQREQAFLGFSAIYSGLSGSTGKRYEKDAVLDDGLVEKAASMITGGVTERGGKKVIMPYGMSEKLFGQMADAILDGEAERTGISVGQLRAMPMIPVSGSDGSYYLRNGSDNQINPVTGQPIVVQIK